MVIDLAISTLQTIQAEAGDSDTQALRAAFERLSKDDITALEHVYDLCADDLYGLALWSTGSRADASDIVQEVFLKLARKRLSLAEIQKPRSYILQITHRLCIDFFRDRQKRMTREEPIELLEPHFMQYETNHYEAIQLYNAMAKLGPKQREVLYLRYFVGLSFSEIPEVSELSLFTAAGRCRIALQRLRALLREKA